MLFRPCIFVLAVSFAGGCFAQTYVGAEGALKAINVASKTPPKPNAGDLLRIAVKAYRREASKLSTKQSAQRWLSLADRATPGSAMDALEFGRRGPGNSDFAQVTAALPSPSVWPSLENLLDARLAKNSRPRDVAMLAMVETLRGERKEAWITLGKLKGLSLEQAGILSSIPLDLAMVDQNKDEIFDAYRKQAIALSQRTQPIGGEKTMELPDLSALVGPERAQNVLRAILDAFDGEVVVHGSQSFKKMARDTALAEVAKLKHPQWTLAIDNDGGRLFEALHKRFPEATHGIQQNQDWRSASDSMTAAAWRYIGWLVANGHTDEASAFMKNEKEMFNYVRGVSPDESNFLYRVGKQEEFLRFMQSQIAEDAGLLDAYVGLCDELGRGDQADAFVASLPAKLRSTLRDPIDRLVTKLLAQGKVAEAGEVLFKTVQTPPATYSNSESYPNSASQLVDIGHYLHRQDYVDAGISWAVKKLKSDSSSFFDGWVCLELANDNRGPEAERLIADVLQLEANQSQSMPPAGKEEYGYLVRLYAKAERWADLLDVLDEAPNWESADVEFVDNQDRRQNSTEFLTARALAAVGRRSEALHVLKFVLQSKRDLDQAYDLLLQIDPVEAGGLLDTMHRVSPLETRPLIWKAELLRRKGRLAEADKLIHQAIALDPQDTQGWESNTRFQAWEILARIERDQGMTQEARIHERMFTSPHKQYVNNGADNYTLEIDGPANRLQALADNPDDFNMRFSIMGDLKKAGKHEDAKAQASEACRRLLANVGDGSETFWWDDDPEFVPVYESVIREEIRKNPKRAMNYAVLGNLFETIGLNDNARDSYLAAVALDHDNLLAWKGLANLQREIVLPVDLGERVTLNLVRLAPLDQIWSEGTTRNFSALWSTTEAAVRGALSVDEPIFHLRASAITVTESDAQNNDYSRTRNWPPTPGSMITQDRTISDFVRLIGTLRLNGNGNGNGDDQ